jgi:hypothetical protein
MIDNDVLNLREMGIHHSPVEQALMILSKAYPDMTWEQLEALSIGERDARLLAVREQTFGTTLNIFTTCPKCRQALELSLSTVNLRSPPPAEAKDSGHKFSMRIDDVKVRYRLPDSTDLEAISACMDLDQARKLLLDRCVLEIHDIEGKSHQPITKYEEIYSPDFITALARQMAEQDPQAEVILNLKCAECENEWQALFDIASFFWTELETHAKRVLSEIYILARTYHWREQDILALTPARRKWYLEIATA